MKSILSYKDFINESVILRPGKERALKMGKDILSEAQFALTYLASFGNDSKEMLEVMKISDNYKAMSGIKPSTWEHCIRKWKVVAHDADYETTPGPEMEEFYTKFQDMNSKELIELAVSCFDEEHTKNWDSAVEDIRQKNLDREKNKKSENSKTESKIYQSLKDYMKAFKNDLDKCVKVLIKQNPQFTEKQLKDIWNKR